jgi:hypothetical protein
MNDLYGMRNIRPLEHIDGDGLSPSDTGGMGHMRAKLNEEQTRLPGLWPPIGDFGETPNLLK